MRKNPVAVLAMLVVLTSGAAAVAAGFFVDQDLPWRFKQTLEVVGATQLKGATTLGTTGTAISDSYAGSFTIDFAGVTDVCEDSAAQTLTGAAVNDVCVVGAPATGPHANSWFTCYVSATNAVIVRHCAHGASGNLAAGTYAVRVFDP